MKCQLKSHLPVVGNTTTFLRWPNKHIWSSGGSPMAYTRCTIGSLATWTVRGKRCLTVPGMNDGASGYETHPFETMSLISRELHACFKLMRFFPTDRRNTYRRSSLGVDNIHSLDPPSHTPGPHPQLQQACDCPESEYVLRASLRVGRD